MKKILLILSIAFSLCSSPVNASASGCGFHFWIGIPFLFGIGFGAPCGYPYTCGYPVYSHPTHTDSPSQAHVAPIEATAQSPASQIGQLWTPSTPGAGAWISDPQPYFYSPTI